MLPLHPHRCPELFAPTGPRCELPSGHHGSHTAAVRWGGQWEDDAPTISLPPIRDTIGPRRRPPSPEVRELASRAELLEAMGRELGRELRELLAGDDDAPTPDHACYTCAHPASHHGGDGCDTWLAGEARRCGCVADPHGDDL